MANMVWKVVSIFLIPAACIALEAALTLNCTTASTDQCGNKVRRFNFATISKTVSGFDAESQQIQVRPQRTGGCQPQITGRCTLSETTLPTGGSLLRVLIQSKHKGFDENDYIRIVYEGTTLLGLKGDSNGPLVNDGGSDFQVENTGKRWGVQLPASATSLPSITFSLSGNSEVFIIGAAVLGSGCQIGKCPGERSSTVIMSCWSTFVGSLVLSRYSLFYGWLVVLRCALL
jgi:hypothetical protein